MVVFSFLQCICMVSSFLFPDEEDLPVKPSKDWVHMDVVENEKLAWMKKLPPPKADSSKVEIKKILKIVALFAEFHYFVRRIQTQLIFYYYSFFLFIIK